MIFSIREHIDYIHTKAEQTAWSQLLVNGTLTPAEWSNYLYNIILIYSNFESRDLFADTELMRSNLISQDLIELKSPGKIAKSTQDYCQWLNSLSDADIWAPIYVHYLGDLYGMNMIAERQQIKLSYLKYNDRFGMIDFIRTNSRNINKDIAIKSFEWIIKIYDELYSFSR
jgi:heme oxygenase